MKNEISDKDFTQAVEKAVLLMGVNPSVTELVNSLKKQFTEVFNKNGIKILLAAQEKKYSVGPPKTLEQRISDLETMVYTNK